MRITRLHIILIAIVLGTLIVFSFQVQQARKQKEELALTQAQQQVQRVKIEQEKTQKKEEPVKKKVEEPKQESPKREDPSQDIEKKKKLAVESIAVAGEYWQIAKKENRDLTKGQATLHKAKESLEQNNFELAWDLAHQSIKEFKEAPKDKKSVHYKVVSGDCLWKIAKKPQHYGDGEKWPKIWHANENIIHNPRLIYPKQVLLIPDARSNVQVKKLSVSVKKATVQVKKPAVQVKQTPVQVKETPVQIKKPPVQVQSPEVPVRGEIKDADIYRSINKTLPLETLSPVNGSDLIGTLRSAPE